MSKIEADIRTTNYDIIRTVSAMPGRYGGTDLTIQFERGQTHNTGQVVQLAKGAQIRRLPGGCPECPLFIGRNICVGNTGDDRMTRLKCDGFVYDKETATATLHCLIVAGGRIEPNTEVPDAAKLAMDNGALCLQQSAPLFAGKDGKSSIKSHRPGSRN